MLVAAALGASAMMSCGDTVDPIDEVLAAMDRTERLSKEVSYAETTTSRTHEVEVRLEDAFRYEAEMAVDGRRLLHEVVQDDSLSVRTLAPETFNPGEGTDVGPVLAEGVWVQDPAGAPPIYIVGPREGQPEGRSRGLEVGRDPVSDALNVLEYVRTAIQQSDGVSRFDEDSPFYIPSQDPFRGFIEPDEESGIERFDVARAPLPQTPESGEIPGSEAFRKMAIYVKDGRVVRVLEEIDVEGHREFVDARREGEPEFLLDLLEAVKQGRGDEEVRPREMAVRFTALGDDVEISIPADVRMANLRSLVSSGSLHKFPDLEGGGGFEPDLDGTEQEGGIAGLEPGDASTS